MGLVQEYNYIPNQIAQGLRRNNSDTIGVVTYDISDPYVIEIVRGIEAVCKANRLSVIICNTSPEKEKELEDLRFLGSKMVDGIIFLRSLSPRNEEWVSNIKIPIIVVDRELSIHIPDMGMVDSNSVDAIYQATQLLIREGCCKISYIGPSPDMRSSNRMEGYRNALRDNGILPDEQLLYQKGAFSPETGIEGASSLFAEAGIDGVVCANDLIASGVLLALSRKGIRVPEEVKVIGTDNIPLSQKLIDCEIVMRESV